MWPFKKKNIEILAPCDGEIVSLDKVEDDVFREKMMGDGFAIIPSSNDFFAPIAGKLMTVFPTKHAYGIQTKQGVELLIHIGLDTVTLKGAGFDSVVEQDQMIKANEKLVTVDLKKIAKKVPSITTPIVFTNPMEKSIEIVKFGKVKQGEVVAILK
ncbi:PTS sugar transporter subunit IIA [Mycoplasma yeatsii]|uniref:PTS system glucose-specific IIA component n=1 Tax=Mycoplasma yeatsii TaxID=51365 RepID=A0ABU0NES5_9MOLU|nr:PTS glucose transporter subunit IIA [Mycoplasma yeatsii]MDQ0567900.1 PTS system glucose-specific IIA component [Mycoplasma yeatsii]